MGWASNTTSIGRVRDFLARSRPGWVLVYHEGFLARDRWEAEFDDVGAPVFIRRVQPLDMIADLLMEAAQQGRVALLQRKIGPEHYEYKAVRV